MLLAERVVKCLKEKGMHICTAESCTGGALAAGLVDVAGASEVFEEGYITYSDRVKERVLGVPKELLEEYTAVSGQVAEKMAEGAAKKSGADLGLSVTGYAGPGPAEDGTPAGTVYIGIWYRKAAASRLYHLTGDRNGVRAKAVQEALALAEEMLKT